MTNVINFFAGPGAGKSTMAAQVFGKMKAARWNAEYVPEYAKQLTWDKRHEALDDQLYVFAKQHHRHYMLRDQVEYIVTDSPLLLSLVYKAQGMRKMRAILDPAWDISFTSLVLSTIKFYTCANYYVDRKDRAFMRVGRNQDEKIAKIIDEAVLKTLHDHHVNFKTVTRVEEVYEDLGLES